MITGDLDDVIGPKQNDKEESNSKLPPSPGPAIYILRFHTK